MKDGENPRLDFDDLQLELMGEDGPRQQRFLSEEVFEDRSGRSGKNRRGLEATRLAQLTAQLALEQQRQVVRDAIVAAETRAEAALMLWKAALDERQTNLDDLLANAARIPGGDYVFMDASGVVRAEDGSAIDPAVADGVIWPDGAPSYEELLATRESVAEARTAISTIERFQVEVIGTARDRVESPDATAEDLTAIQTALERELPTPSSDSAKGLSQKPAPGSDFIPSAPPI